MTDIKTRVAELKKQIDIIRTQIREIQSACPHLAVKEKYRRDLCCYPYYSQYEYWLEMKCLDCDIEWNVELDGPVEGVDYDK